MLLTSRNRLLTLFVILLAISVNSALGVENKISISPSESGKYELENDCKKYLSISQQANSIRLKYKKIVKLNSDITSLKIWCFPAKYFKISAIITDSQGNSFEFPFRMGLPLYNTLNTGWGRYGTGNVGINPDSYSSIKVTRPLSLTGFLIKHKFKTPTKLSLGWLSFETKDDFKEKRWEILSLEDFMKSKSWRRMEDSGRFFVNSDHDKQPRIAIEKLTVTPGQYIVNIKIRDYWQGPVVIQKNIPLNATIENIKSPVLNPLIIPTPQTNEVDKSYFLEVRVYNHKGYLTSKRTYWMNLYNWSVNTGAKKSITTLDNIKMPILSLECGKAGVIYKEKNATCALKISNVNANDDLTLQLNILNYNFTQIDDVKIKIKTKNKLWQKKIELKKYLSKNNLIRIHATLKSNNYIIDKDSILVGDMFNNKVINNLKKYRSLKKYGDSRHSSNTIGSCFLVPYIPPKQFNSKQYLDHIKEGIKWVKSSGQHVLEIAVPWSDIEPLPGIYNFNFLDEIILFAEEQNIEVMLTVWNFADYFPRWLLKKPMRYEDGSTSMYCRNRCAVDFANPVHRKATARLWATVAERYSKHNIVRGYLIPGPHCDAGYIDINPYLLAGYSPAFIEDWKSFILKKYKSLDNVSVAHKKIYKDLSSLIPPRPILSGVYDTRQVWLDFIDFRFEQLSHYYENIYKSIRKYAPNCELFQYGLYNVGSVERFFPLFKQYNIGLTAGTSEFEHLQRYSALASLWDIPYRGEPATAQAVNSSNFNMGMWNQLPYGNRNNQYSIQWHGEFPADWNNSLTAIKDLIKWNKTLSNPLTRLMKYDMPSIIKNWTKVLDELSGAEPLGIDVGCMFSGDWSAYYYRNFSSGHITGQNLSLLMNSKLHRIPQWFSEYTPLDKIVHLKAILLDSDMKIINKSSIDKLVKYIEGGGVVITSVDAGALLAGNTNVSFPLLARLGLKIPGTKVNEKKSSDMILNSTPCGTISLSNYYKMQLPAGASVISRGAQGEPLCFLWSKGKGKICLFAGSLVYSKSAKAIDALLNYLGIDKVANIESTNQKMRIFRMRKGQIQYFGAGYVYNGYNVDYSKGIPKHGKLEFVKIKLNNLPKMKYRIKELTFPYRDFGIVESSSLEDGLQLYLKPGELAIFACYPINSSGI